MEDQQYDGWELRFTHGFTGRANSVQLKKPSTIDLPEKVDYCEKAYADHGMPCIFKLTDVDRDFITYLEERGYQAVKPTDVMTLELTDENTDYDTDAVLNNVIFSDSPDDWFEPYFAYEGLTDEDKQDMTRKIHAKVPASKVYIKVMEENRVAAVASLATESGYSLLHNVCVKDFL